MKDLILNVSPEAAEQVFVPPRQLAEFDLKRPPEEWRWIKPG